MDHFLMIELAVVIATPLCLVLLTSLIALADSTYSRVVRKWVAEVEEELWAWSK